MDDYERTFYKNALRFLIKSTLEIMMNELEKQEFINNFSSEEIREIIVDTTNDMLLV